MLSFEQRRTDGKDACQPAFRYVLLRQSRISESSWIHVNASATYLHALTTTLLSRTAQTTRVMVATDFFERLRAIIQAVEPSPDDSDWKEDLYTNIQSLVNDYSCHHCPRFVIGDGKNLRYIDRLMESLKYRALDSPSTDVTPTPERKLSDPSMDPSLESAEEETPEANDDKILARLKTGQLKHRELEKEVGPQSAVHYRRKYVEEKSGVPLADLPHLAYDYETVGFDSDGESSLLCCRFLAPAARTPSAICPFRWASPVRCSCRQPTTNRDARCSCRWRPPKAPWWRAPTADAQLLG